MRSISRYEGDQNIGKRSIIYADHNLRDPGLFILTICFTVSEICVGNAYDLRNHRMKSMKVKEIKYFKYSYRFRLELKGLAKIFSFRK